MKLAKAKDEVIHKIEVVPSEIGLLGSNVKIEDDMKKSQNGNLIPMKPSIVGVKARIFLSFHGHIGKVNSKIGGSSIKWNQWKALHNAVKDHGDDGESHTTGR